MCPEHPLSRYHLLLLAFDYKHIYKKWCFLLDTHFTLGPSLIDLLILTIGVKLFKVTLGTQIDLRKLHFLREHL